MLCTHVNRMRNKYLMKINLQQNHKLFNEIYLIIIYNTNDKYFIYNAHSIACIDFIATSLISCMLCEQVLLI